MPALQVKINDEGQDLFGPWLTQNVCKDMHVKPYVLSDRYFITYRRYYEVMTWAYSLLQTHLFFMNVVIYGLVIKCTCFH